MCRKLTCLVSFVLALAPGSAARAADVTWTDVVGDHLWNTARNWDTGAVPTAADTAKIRTVPGPNVPNPDAVASLIHVGAGGSTAELTVNGGTLTIIDRLVVAQGQGSVGTVNMIRGTVTIGGRYSVGRYGSGTLNLTGGTIVVETVLQMPEMDTGAAHANLAGGVLSAGSLEMRAAGGVGTMNVGAGTLILDGNVLSRVQGYIDKGWIAAYEGDGTLRLDYDVTNPGRTTVKAIHLLNPNPADGAPVPVSISQLQWTLPEPNRPGGVVTCDVYFGANPDVETNPKIVVRRTVESAPVTLAPATVYYWALDVYDSSISDTEPFLLSPVFTFNTMNQAPTVKAGADVVTWLPGGPRAGKLDATVTDDGALIPYTVKWTVLSEPSAAAAVFQTATIEDTTVTLSAAGRYVLQLEASDGEYTGSDTVVINVYDDPCQAARSVPGYQPLVGDLNGDCRVDGADLALLQANWLKDNSLSEDWFLLP
ncbi:MAG: hypothetical protein MUC88_15040 [Planctomycetes bacterium]|nr:hypothetical protein [Planctomycetota bacterium]